MRPEVVLVVGGLLGCSANEGTGPTDAGGAAAGSNGDVALAGDSAQGGGVPALPGAGTGSGGAPASSAGTANAAGLGGASAAGAGGAPSAAGTAGDSASCTGEAMYSITVDITWADDAVAGKHYTTLIGAVHSGVLDVWHPGGLATSGIKQMAESGGTQALSEEVQAAIDQGTALSIIKFSGGNPPASSTGQILVNAEFPFVSLGSMMAPTPDNFVGLSSLSLCEEGQFVASKQVEADVYDAGTKDGDEFTYGSGATTPPAPIALAKQFSAAQGTITLQKL